MHNDSDIIYIIATNTNISISNYVIPPEPTDIHPDMGPAHFNFDQILHVAGIYWQTLTGAQLIQNTTDIDHPDSIFVNKLSSNIFGRR